MSKVAVISGVSRGVGYHLAEELLIDGWTVIGLSRTPCHLELEHPRFVPVQCNITDKLDIKKAFSGLIDTKNSFRSPKPY